MITKICLSKDLFDGELISIISPNFKPILSDISSESLSSDCLSSESLSSITEIISVFDSESVCDCCCNIGSSNCESDLESSLIEISGIDCFRYYLSLSYNNSRNYI